MDRARSNATGFMALWERARFAQPHEVRAFLLPRLPRSPEFAPPFGVKRVGDRHSSVGALPHLQRLPVGMVAPDESHATGT